MEKRFFNRKVFLPLFRIEIKKKDSSIFKYQNVKCDTTVVIKLGNTHSSSRRSVFQVRAHPYSDMKLASCIPQSGSFHSPSFQKSYLSHNAKFHVAKEI